MEFEKTHNRRIVAMMLLCVIALGFGIVRIFGYQIVNGAGYVEQSQKSTETKVAVTAARGEIVDRNGVPLTRNEAVFHLEFDFTAMKKKTGSKTQLDNDTANATISRLMTAFDKLGESWLDELPVTMTEPYEFKETATESEKTKLRNLLSLNDYATAQDCVYWLFQNFGIKKYKIDGKCSHCGQKYELCEYQGYDELTSRKIAGVRYQMMLTDFSGYEGHTRFTFADDVSPESVAWLQEQSTEFPGTVIAEKPRRTYVSGDVAPSIIGEMSPIYAGEYEDYKKKGYQMSDIVGRSGVERAMEDVLRGTDGVMGVIQNTKGEVIDTYEITPAVAGNTVQLTLDYYFQKELQRILKDYVENYNKSIEGDSKKTKSQAASIVVLDAKTGGVLAAISYPYYDINVSKAELNALDGNPAFNRAFLGTYRPGSTFKPIVAAGGLAEGIITPSNQIRCTGVYEYYPAPFRPSCLLDKHRVGAMLDVSHALQVSCNIFFYDVGRRLTIEKMGQYANLFGLGVDTGLEKGISSASGKITSRSDSNWQEGNVVQAAIGQGETGVTPLQMATEAMTLGNQGVRYETHLVKSVLSYDGSQVIKTKDPVIAAKVPMTDDAMNAIRTGMVLMGQGIRAPYELTDLGYSVAAKTGTPQVTETRLNSAAIAYAPADNPEISISIMLENTDNRTYVAKNLLRQILLTWAKAKANPGVDLSTLPSAASSESSSESAASSGSQTSGGTSSRVQSSASEPSSSATVAAEE